MIGDLSPSFRLFDLSGALSVWCATLAALSLASTAIWVSYGVVHVLLPRRAWVVRLVALLVTGTWTASIAFHVLLVAESFKVLPAIGVLGACAVAVRLGGYTTAAFRADARRDRRCIVRSVVAASGGRAGSWFCVLPLVVPVWLAWWSVFIIPMGWDTLTYHGVKAGLWVQQGLPISLTAPGGWAYYKNFFGGGEMLMAWAMLPFHSDLLAGLVDWVGWVGFGLAFWGVAAEMGIAPRLRFPCLAFVMTLPAVYRLVGSGYVELSLYCFLFAGLLLVLHHRRRGGRGSLVLAAAALGLACAVKVTALAYVGLVSLTAVGLELRYPRLRGSRMVTLLLVLAVFGVAWVPWLGLNYRDTGFVLGTTPFELLGVRLGQLTPEMAWYLDRPDLSPYDPVTEARALREIVGPLRSGSPVIGPLSVPLLLGGVVGVVRLARRNRPGTWLGSAYALAAVVMVYQPAFSVVRILFPQAVGRFLVPTVAIAALFLSAGVGRDAWARRALPAYLWYGSVLHLTALLDGMGGNVLPWVATAAMTTFVASWGLARLGPAHRRPATVAIVGVGLVVGLPTLDAWKHTERTPLYAENYAIRDISREWLPTVQHTDAIEPLRIAFSSGRWQHHDQQFLYPFLGARLQHTLLYVPTSVDGTILPHDGPVLRSGETSFDSWVARLTEQRVTHVMSFGPPTVELAWMEAASDRFRRLEGDGRNWGFYQFRDRIELWPRV